ncbi:hypothetical protein [Bartonella sp. CM120XJJH]
MGETVQEKTNMLFTNHLKCQELFVSTLAISKVCDGAGLLL